ncbi:MAG: flagellar hook-length control protein FliK, partial [Lachnospiraceae bacterium]|nr:flagellar hook-length control protein FliK [Lachnospiraceae bacterium]
TTEKTAGEAVANEKTAGPFSAAGKFFQTLSDSAKNTLSDTLQAFRAPKEDPAPEAPASKPGNESLNIIADTYEKYSHENDLVSHYLSTQERNGLLNHMQNMPISRNMLLKIASGEATTKDIMTVLHNTISMSDSEQVKALFQTEGFEKLFARMLQSNWTLTPKDLQKENIGSFYNKMHDQLSSFRNLIQSSLSGSDSESLGSSAKNMEDNINFMKMLNENFSYFQLPLKLPSQDAHGDLYVYTQKESLKNHPDKNSVLLHLDMEHLGKIDIRIDRNRNDVLTNFSLNDEESVNLFRVNQEMLKNALGLQGYSCQVQITKKEEPSPTMDDFINTKVNTHATTEMKRFTFDIRA